MLDKFLVLLERFVVAHELIAANSAKTTVIEKVGDAIRAEEKPAAELPVEGEDVIETPKAKRTAATKPDAAHDLADEAPQEKPKRKPRQPKAPAPDLKELRDELKTIATHISAGDSDECADEFDDLLEEYGVRTVPKIKDEDVEAFHKAAKALVSRYYEIED